MDYEALRTSLDAKMSAAGKITDQQEQQNFVTDTFVDIHKAYTQKHVDHAEYVKLVNRLAAYKNGAFNDYMDTLAGAAQMNMLDLIVTQSRSQNVAAQSRKRSKTVTDLTGVQLPRPDDTV